MKKTYLVILLLFVFLLSSCKEENKTCSKEERLIDGVCIVLDSHEQSLYDTFLTLNDLDNYTMDVSIIGQDTRYDMNLFITETVSKVESEDGSRIELHKKDENNCLNKYIYNEQIKETNDICTAFNDYKFFMNFEYQWFELKEGNYSIKSEYLDDVETLLEEYFNSAAVTELKIGILDQHLSDIAMTLRMNERNYVIHMSIYDIDETIVIFDEVS